MSWSPGLVICVRGDPFITFASRGGGGAQKLPKIANGSTDRLREMRIKGGRGLKSQKICERNKWMPPNGTVSR